MLTEKLIADTFESAKITLSDEQARRFVTYGELLSEWNEKINLTAITEPSEVALKHFLDSVLPFGFIDIPKNASVIDVGTGAGFPSCPLKIMNGGISLTLLDSLNKRVKFLSELSDRLSLGAECIHARAEDAGHNDMYREKFDIATARAVAALFTLCEYCMPFVKVGGAFAALKGPDCTDEISGAQKAVKTLGGKIEMTKEYSLPNGDRRTLVVIRKISHTPTIYPRNKAQMTKKPLK